jgi:hypothetical protein
MTRQYDEAAAEARGRVLRPAGRDLETLKLRHPVGAFVRVGEEGEFKMLARVTGHKLSTYYKPLVVTTQGVYYSFEVESTDDE